MYEELRKRVYEANMELYRRNMVLYTWGNVSEADREQGVFAIKPSGVKYEDLRTEDIVIVRIEDGVKVDGEMNPSSDTPTHAGLYRAFPEIGGVTHTHSTCATAWAQAGKSIPCFGTTHADYYRSDIPVTRYISKEEVDRGYELETANVIKEAFIGRNPVHTPAVLVRGHGPFTWGKDADNSVYNAVVLEEVAKMAMYTLSITPEQSELPVSIQDKHFLRKHGPNAYYGQGH
ncbi:MAG: L-ribulose-5-phosphate 4-epimerase [Clostridia bacterium]|nr:L-ribulose-5-phosphate 4-epimerase [Clostridia bacterium]